MFTCTFCEHNFSSQYNLKIHQTKTKYCLTKQGKDVLHVYKCICDKEFLHKNRFDEHQVRCNKIVIINERKKFEEELEILKSRMERQINIINIQKRTIIKQHEEMIKLKCIISEREKITSEYKEERTDLTNKIHDLAVRGIAKHSVNNSVTNTIKLEVLSKEHLDSAAKLITQGDLLNVETLATFAVNNSFKDRVIATDRTRKTLTYKNKDGNFQKDPRGRILAQKFFESLKKVGCIDMASELKNQFISELKKQIEHIDEKQLEELQKKIDQIFNIESGIKEISDDEETELRDEFVEMLCKLLPNKSYEDINEDI